MAAGAPPLPPANAFLRIGTDDSVTVLIAHSEMGQGIWTGLAMLIAEELECDWSKVTTDSVTPGRNLARFIVMGVSNPVRQGPQHLYRSTLAPQCEFALFFKKPKNLPVDVEVLNVGADAAQSGAELVDTGELGRDS